MATITVLRIKTEDAQGVSATSEFRVVDADFGATTLPTQAKIEVVVNAIFGNAKLSDQIVTSYEIAVVNTTPTASEGGNGNVATPIAARIRNGIGEPYEELYSLPGLNKALVTFNPRSKSEISVVGGLWDAYRAALHDAVIGYQSMSGSSYGTDEIAEVATSYNGKRKAPQPS